MPETRPRITFNAQGVCNACSWAEEKKQLNWKPRQQQLKELCDKYRSKDGNFDCLVPVSGGKDSSYVSYMLKHEQGMHPLCMNIVPPYLTDIQRQSLENFNNHGYDLMMISPNPNVARKLARRNLIEHGQPLIAWINTIHAAAFKLAIKLDIPLVMFGEEGETEYGGTSKLKDGPLWNIEDSIQIYLSGSDPDRYRDEFSQQELYWWLYPSADEFRRAQLAVAHWSYFEDWDPYHHYLVAKDKCGLQERPQASIGTFTNYASTDTPLYDLHCYLMYLKFGCGRCTKDVGVEIRRGAMTRKQGIELVRMYDGQLPEQDIPLYQEYHLMTATEFDDALDRWANKKLFEKKNGRWTPLFDVV